MSSSTNNQIQCTWIFEDTGPCPKVASPRHMNGYRSHEGPLCGRCYAHARKAQGMCKEPDCQATAYHYGRCRPHEHLPLRRLTDVQLEDVRGQLLEVIDPDPIKGCWIFNQYTVDGRNGRINGRHGIGTWLAHRLAYHLWFNGHANGLELDHLCENPLCLSPYHLRPATPKANNALRDLRRKNPDFPWWSDATPPPAWPMGMVLFAMMNGLPAGLPGGDLHRQTSAVVGQGVEGQPPF